MRFSFDAGAIVIGKIEFETITPFNASGLTPISATKPPHDPCA